MAYQMLAELLMACFKLEKALLPNRPPSSTIAINRHATFLPHRDNGAGSSSDVCMDVHVNCAHTAHTAADYLINRTWTISILNRSIRWFCRYCYVWCCICVMLHFIAALTCWISYPTRRRYCGRVYCTRYSISTAWIWWVCLLYSFVILLPSYNQHNIVRICCGYTLVMHTYHMHNHNNVCSIFAACEWVCILVCSVWHDDGWCDIYPC